MKSFRFIEWFWYPSRRYRSLFYYIFWLFNVPFLLLVKLKYVSYNMKILKSNHFSKPIVVVGNLSVGGTGKTPFIANLVKLLNQHDISCGIVSRGYYSKVEKLPHQVSGLDSASRVGDEAFMQYQNLKIPIVIDANRSNAVNYLIDNNDIDIVISDDGLQHYQMQRDFEIVIMDSSRAFGNKLVLPFGPLREPISRCHSVDLLVKNGHHLTEVDIESIAHEEVSIRAKQLVNLKTGEKVRFEDFSSRSVFAVAGIGNPHRFFETLESICTVTKTKTFNDHHAFCENDFLSLSDDIETPVIMTEKDAVKCKKFAKDNWFYLQITMQFEENLADKLLLKIQGIIERKVHG